MEQAPPDEPLTIAHITGCARCGGSHEGIVARRMARPFAPAEAFDPQRGQLTWTHWALCPTNGDPILIMVEPGSEVRRG